MADRWRRSTVDTAAAAVDAAAVAVDRLRRFRYH